MGGGGARDRRRELERVAGIGDWWHTGSDDDASGRRARRVGVMALGVAEKETIRHDERERW